MQGSMAQRYKKKEFKTFERGLGYDFASETAFADSESIEIDSLTLKAKLLSGLSSQDITDTVQNPQVTETFGGNIYVIVGNATPDTVVYRSTNAGVSFSLFQTLTGSGQPVTIFRVQNKLFVVTDTLGVYKFNGSTFVAVGGSGTIIFLQNAITVTTVDDYIYFWGHITKTEILRTKDDFFTYEIVYSINADVDIPALSGLLGLPYFTYDDKFYRLSKTGAEELHRFQNDPQFVGLPGDFLHIFVAVGTVASDIFIFDGATITKQKRLNGYKFPTPLSFDGVFTYFVTIDAITSEYVVFKVDEEGSIFKLSRFASTLSPTVLRADNGQVYTQVQGGGSITRVYRGSNYATSGTLSTGVINVGKMVPVAAILRHKPLVTGTSVKLYAKKDRSPSWGSSLVIDATVGAVEAQYDFPNTYGKVTFFELRVELLTSDTTKTPEDVELVFLYLPIGLEASV